MLSKHSYAFVLAAMGTLLLSGAGDASGPPWCGKDGGRRFPDTIRTSSGQTFYFGDACRKHDNCYAKPLRSKGECDRRFSSDLLQACETARGWTARGQCRAAAKSYAAGVKARIPGTGINPGGDARECALWKRCQKLYAKGRIYTNCRPLLRKPRPRDCPEDQ